MLRITLKTACSVLSGILLCSASAWSDDYWQGIELSAGLGPTWAHAADSTTVITTQETDTNLVNRVNRSTTYQMGVGYHLFSHALQDRKFFNDLLVQLNLSRNNATTTGNVLEFGSSDFNAFSFSAPIRSTTLLLNVKPSLFTVAHCSPYPIVGAGVSWNRAAFSEHAFSADDADGEIVLPAHTQKNFAYDVGFGVRDALTKNINISLEYLATYLGKMKPSVVSESTQTILSAPSFSVHNQNLLLTFGWTF